MSEINDSISFEDLIEKTEIFLKNNKNNLKELSSVDSLIEYVFPIMRKLKSDISIELDRDITEIIEYINGEDEEDDEYVDYSKLKEISSSILDYLMMCNMLIDVLMSESGMTERNDENSVKFTNKFENSDNVKYLYSEVSGRQFSIMESLKDIVNSDQDNDQNSDDSEESKELKTMKVNQQIENN